MEWLAVIIGTVAAVLIIFAKGFSRGKDAAKLDNTEKVLDNVAKAKKAADAVAGDDADDVRDRLRANAKK